MDSVAQVFVYGFSNILVPGLFTLSFVVFLWGVFQFFIAGPSDEAMKEMAKAVMLYGILALIVMFVVWLAGDVLMDTISALIERS